MRQILANTAVRLGKLYIQIIGKGIEQYNIGEKEKKNERVNKIKDKTQNNTKN